MAFKDLRRAQTEIEGAGVAGDPQATPNDAVVAASRRRFFTKAAAGTVVAFGATAIPLTSLMPEAWAQEGGGAGATSSGPGTTAGSTKGTTTPGTAAAGKKEEKPKVTGNDLTLLVFAQTIEIALAQAYDAIIKSAKLSPELTQTARDFQRHHDEHSTEIGTWLGSEALHTANEKLLTELTTQISGATTQAAVAAVAYGFEEGAASTYQFLLGEIEDWEVAGVASTIEPIEAQHSLVWSLIAEPGDAWAQNITTYIPNFQPQADAYTPSAYPAS